MVTPAWKAARLLRSLGWLWLALSSGCDSSEHNFKRELIPGQNLDNVGVNADGTASQLLDDPEYAVFIPCANEYVPSDVEAGVATLASGGSETCFSVKIVPAGLTEVSHDMQGDEFYVTPTYDADRDEYDVQFWWLPQAKQQDEAGDESMAGVPLAYEYYYRIQPLASEQAAEWRAIPAVQGGLDAGTFSGDTTIILTLQMMSPADNSAEEDSSRNFQGSGEMKSLEMVGTATLWLQYNKVTDSFAYSSGAFGHFVKVYDSVSTHDTTHAESHHSQDVTPAEITATPDNSLGQQTDAHHGTDDLPVAVGMVDEQQMDNLPTDDQDQHVENVENVENFENQTQVSYQATRFYTQVATRAITVSWDEDLAQLGQMGVVDFEYRLGPTQGWQSMGLSSPFVIESLEPSQLYRLQLRSVYSLDLPKQVSPAAEVALSTLSQEHAERAQEEAPTEKLVFSVYPHADTVEVSWRIPRVFDVTKIIDYQYQLVQSGSAWQSMGLSGFYEIKDLQPGQIYVLKFRVVYADGPSGEVTASIKTLHHSE